MCNLLKDVASYPASRVDVFGNSFDGYLGIPTLAISTANTDKIAFNASDNAANTARSNVNLPAYIFTVGLGGTTGAPPNHVLMQRMANDPSGDPTVPYPAITIPAARSSQPAGSYVYAADPSKLSAAFLKISSMILRLSR
jgi:hypothetical protein